MGKKYTIELERGETAYKTVDSNGTPLIQLLAPTPYTEPDLEQVREEAYEKGYDASFGRKIDASYQEGLSDAWEAARKIWENDMDTLQEIFGWVPMRMDVFLKYTASECIEKIRQYEQRQEEQIQVGDEVENTQTGVKFIVTHLWKNNRGEQGVSGFNQECSAFSTTLSLVVKSGRHFPEIAEVLEKMKETDNE